MGKNILSRIKLAGIAAAVIAAATVTGIPTQSAQAQTANKQVTVVVPNPSAITWTPMWVAIGEGFFADEGIDLTVEAVDGSAQVLQALAAGQADIGAPGAAPVLAARLRGVDVVYLYNLYPNSVFGLMVRADSPVTKPSDLKGKIVGIGTADGAEVGFTRALLSGSGMTEGKDYTFLPVGDGGLAAAAFLRGEIDAYAAAVSDAAIITARGLPLREITPEAYLAFFGNGYAALRSYIGANRDVIEGFGRAMVRGMKVAIDKSKRDVVLADTTAGNPQEGEDRAFAEALLGQAVARMEPTQKFAGKGFGYMPPEHWEIWQKSLLEAGVLKKPLPDLKAAYTNEFVATWNGKKKQ